MKVLLSLEQQLLDFFLHVSCFLKYTCTTLKQFCPNPLKAENVLRYFTDLLGAASC